MPKLKLYKTSVSSKTDKHLCEFLCSSYNNLRVYKRENNVSFDEDNERVSARLRFLKSVKSEARSQFNRHCIAYGIDPPGDKLDTNIDIADDSTDTEEMTLDEPLKIPHAEKNEFGKSICFKLPNDVLHCTVYPLVRFDDSMEITISPDGKFIEKKLLKRIPKDASELLNGAVDQNDLLYASAEAEIRRMKKEMNEWEKVDDDPLLQFGEEMAPFFVDRHGRHQDSYTLDTVEQTVSFCVRTLSSMKANRLPPVIKSKQNSPARSSTTRSTASVSGQYINTGFEDMQIEIPTEATTTAATAAPGFVPQMSPEEWAAMQKVIKMFGQTTL